MLRNIFGPLLALIGAVLAVRSSFRVPYGGHHGSGLRVDDLFTGVGITPAAAALLGSLFPALPQRFLALPQRFLALRFRRRPGAYALRDDAPVPFVASSAYTQRSLEQA
jgi:hypothetical protein